MRVQCRRCRTCRDSNPSPGTGAGRVVWPVMVRPKRRIVQSPGGTSQVEPPVGRKLGGQIDDPARGGYTVLGAARPCGRRRQIRFHARLRGIGGRENTAPSRPPPGRDNRPPASGTPARPRRGKNPSIVCEFGRQGSLAEERRARGRLRQTRIEMRTAPPPSSRWPRGAAWIVPASPMARRFRTSPDQRPARSPVQAGRPHGRHA